jgi:hypothetical protein
MALNADQALTAVNRLYNKLSNRRERVRLTDDYYRGRQPLRFASDKWREYHANRYEKFADNWCAPVANSPAERLRVDGFRLSDDPSTTDTEKALWRDWQTNDMEAQSSQGFLASIISARSFVLVWGDSDGNPIVTWERPDQVIVEYDVERPGQRRLALKTWVDDKTEYATLYTPTDVWKWERQHVPASRAVGPLPLRATSFFYVEQTGLIIPTPGDTGWKARQANDDDEWPIKNPLGVVPVIEYQNRPMLGGEPLSDIEGTMAMQDAINLLWAYLFTAADFASMPARVVMGQEPPKIPILGPDGQKVGEKTVDLKKLAEDRILWLTGGDTKIGQWDAARLDVFTGVTEVGVSHIAAQTRTPPHYLILGKGLVNINADGMRAAETGLVMKVGEEQLYFGPSVRETYRLMAMVRDQAAVADQCRFGVVQWKDAENRSEAQTVDALSKLQAMGFPFEWLAERYGLSQTELTRVLAMKQREAESDPIAALARIGASGNAQQPAEQPTEQPPPLAA